MYIHKQVPLLWGKREILIDEGIVPLMQAIWRHDILTTNSCQENRPGVAWVQFWSPPDAASFLNLVCEFPKGKKPWLSMYGRAMGFNGGYDKPTKDWEYHILPFNNGVDEQLVNDELISRYKGFNDFSFVISIRFPVTDIDGITHRLNNATVRN
jgi:hypothetical protein